MARDKARDDKLFNCQQEHEIDYISSLYPDSVKVKEFLNKKCADNIINNYTHRDVYKLIKDEFGFSIKN